MFILLDELLCGVKVDKLGSDLLPFIEMLPRQVERNWWWSYFIFPQFSVL